MKYNIVEKKDYTLFDIYEEYDFDLFMKLFSIMKSKCEDRKIYKVILDVSKVVNLFSGEDDRFYASEEIVLQLGSKIKLAAIAKKEDITYYGENVAKKRGANMRVFSDPDMALEWLLN